MQIIRIKTKDLNSYIQTKNSWKKTSLPEYTKKVILLFKAHNNLKLLIDQKDPKFLKGALINNQCQGQRINVLPDGTKLDKAYSLFAKNLTIHDERSQDHWDVIYQNPNNQFAYLYTQEKRAIFKQKKFQKVKLFKKVYPKLISNTKKALSDKQDHLALPMFTLLNTYMRVGNEIYFKIHKHQGLTTLRKKNIQINNDQVTFSYTAKNGIPMRITKKFPKLYISRLINQLKNLNSNSFVFTTPKGHLLRENQFKEAFLKYCGQEFYPHIIRSFYATKKVEEILKKNIEKKELKAKLYAIAENLGHKTFSKKEHEWKDSYITTLNHYVEPKLAEKVKLLIHI
jgi:hypothetical protein